jgi:hypothetical protein
MGCATTLDRSAPVLNLLYFYQRGAVIGLVCIAHIPSAEASDTGAPIRLATEIGLPTPRAH